jgi:hypothetical protein
MIIHLNENSFNKLFLTEGISDTTYHYCSIDSLYGMLKDGDIKLTMSSNRSDAYHKTKLFYLSTQRSKSVRFGYARNSSSECRVELDGYQLKADGYEGMPLDYWGASMGKQSDIGLNSPRLGIQYGNRLPSIDREEILKAQGEARNFEFEDRIFSETPSLSLKYVNRVDCLVKNIAPIDKAILNLAKDDGVSVFYYNNERDFVLQTENTINQEILMSEGEFEEEPEQMGRPEYKERCAVDVIATLCGMLCYFDKFDENVLGQKTMTALNKFGLEKYYEPVIKLLPKKKMWADGSCESMASEIRKLNTDRFKKTELSNNIMLLAQYVLRIYGVNNFSSLRRYFDENKNGKKKEDNVTQDVVGCVMISYSYNWDNDDWDVYQGDVSFWKWFDKYQFYDEISRQVDDDEWNQQYGETPVITHRSKDNESFKKYIQHIVHNDKLSLYDGSVILSKIYNGNWEKMGEAFGRIVKPIEITKENYFEYENKLNFSARIEVEDKLFRNSEELWKWRDSWNQRKQKVSQS